MLLQQMQKRIKEIIQSKIVITDKNWSYYVKMVPFFNWMTQYLTHPIWGPVMKKISTLEDFDKQFSQGYIVPIHQNVDYKKSAKNSVLPYNMVKKLIKEASYCVVMNKCFCRDGSHCRNYPADFGCIFIGEGCRKLVTNGIAREVTVKEALAHLKEAADMGLVAMCLWMEMEAYGMGLSEEEHKQFLEICLCCPCCCIGLKNFNKMGPDIMRRFGNIGWRASSREGCVGCGLCAQVCPMEAITVNTDSISVSDVCLGCGICSTQCPQNAIGMDQVAPIKKSLLDYFFGFRPDV